MLNQDDSARILHCVSTTDWRITRDFLNSVKLRGIKNSSNLKLIGDLPDFSLEQDMQNTTNDLLKSQDLGEQMAGFYIKLARAKTETERLGIVKNSIDNESKLNVVLDYLEENSQSNKTIVDYLKKNNIQF